MLNTLIVEDNAAHRLVLHRALDSRYPSMRISEAEDGESALRHALSGRFDLVFTDIRIPRGNGLELTRTIKTVFVETVICVITHHDILEYRQAAMRSGADHFLVKGEANDGAIVNVVESLLQTRVIGLLVVSDPLFRERIRLLLRIHWPGMVVAEADGAAGGLEHMAVLKPRLVLVELRLPGHDEVVRRARVACAQVTLIGVADERASAAVLSPRDAGLDFCISMRQLGQAALVAIVDSLRLAQARH